MVLTGAALTSPHAKEILNISGVDFMHDASVNSKHWSVQSYRHFGPLPLTTLTLGYLVRFRVVQRLCAPEALSVAFSLSTTVQEGYRIIRRVCSGEAFQLYQVVLSAVIRKIPSTVPGAVCSDCMARMTIWWWEGIWGGAGRFCPEWVCASRK